MRWKDKAFSQSIIFGKVIALDETGASNLSWDNLPRSTSHFLASNALPHQNQTDERAQFKGQFAIGLEQIKHSFFSNQPAHKQKKAGRQLQRLAAFLCLLTNRLRPLGKEFCIHRIGRGKDVSFEHPVVHDVTQRGLPGYNESAATLYESPFQEFDHPVTAAKVPLRALHPQNEWDPAPACPAHGLP